MRLTDEQIELYSRQIILREVGGTGQAVLRAARVAVLGGGAAAEICTSYLVGAGIGLVDAYRRHSDGERTYLPLPMPERRTADATFGELDRSRRAAITTYDVVLDLDPSRSSVTAARRDATPLPTRLGFVILRTDAQGALQLLLLPAGTGCPVCCPPAGEGSASDAPEADPIASASAGALAALACCRWLLGIGGDTGARTLVLAADGTTWLEDAPPARTRCLRGCPPPTHPV